MTAPGSPLRSISGTDPVLAELMDELGTKLQEGEPVDIEEFIRAHPDQADEIRRLLPALEMLAALERSGGAAAASGDAGVQTPDLERGVLGDFRLLREVGRGGMGVVYEAEQISLSRRVALKVLPFAAALDAKRLQRFKNEAHAAAHLHHTNIVPVISVGCDRSVHYYAMQFIEGETVAQVIADLRMQNADLQKKPKDQIIADLGLQNADLQKKSKDQVIADLRLQNADLQKKPNDPASTGLYEPAPHAEMCNLQSAICNLQSYRCHRVDAPFPQESRLLPHRGPTRRAGG